MSGTGRAPPWAAALWRSGSLAPVYTRGNQTRVGSQPFNLGAVRPDGGYRGGEKGGAGCGPASTLWPARPLGRMRGPPAITRGAGVGPPPWSSPTGWVPAAAWGREAAAACLGSKCSSLRFLLFSPPRSSLACWAPSTAAATSASPAMAAASSVPWGTGSPSSTWRSEPAAVCLRFRSLAFLRA